MNQTLHRPQYSLDDLENLSESELEDLFASGESPPLTAMSHYYEGKVLAGPAVPFNASPGSWFPWKGKTFVAKNEHAGIGISRMQFGPLPPDDSEFDTYPDTSLMDGKPCLVGDFQSLITTRDEFRPIAPDLFLGRYYLQLGDDWHFLLYFALGR